MAAYESLSPGPPGGPVVGQHAGKAMSNSDTMSTDIEMDELREEETKQSEKQHLLRMDKELEKAGSKRKAQLLKVTLVAIICLMQTVALPLFYGEMGNFLGDLSPELFMASKYSLYGTFILSCILAPMFITMFGMKVIFVCGSLMVCVFVSAHFAQMEYSMVPSSIFTGLLMGPFFVAQGVFITNCAYKYCSTFTTCDQDAIVSIVNGLFYAIFLAVPIVSSAIDLLFLHISGAPKNFVSVGNVTASCEPHSCVLYQGYKNELFVLPNNNDFEFSFHRIQALLGTHLAISFTGLVMCALMFNSNHPIITHLRTSKCSEPPDEFKKSRKFQRQPSCQVALLDHFRSSATRWRDVFTVLQDLNLVLVLPFFLYLGLQQGLIYNVFMKDIAGCRLDRRTVYFMRMLTATCSVVTSFPIAILARYVGRFRLGLPVVTAQLSLVLAMLLWQPGLDEWAVLYLVAALWGCGDAVWQIMASALVGRIFRSNKDVAFSHLRLWQMAGILLLDILRTFFCTTFVLSVFIVLFCLTFISLTAFEIRIRLQLRSKAAAGNAPEVRMASESGASWVPKLSPHEARQRGTLSGAHTAR